MSNVFSIFMPGARYWDEVRAAENILLVDSTQGGTGPDQFDLDGGLMVMQDRTGQATEPHTAVGNPNRVRPTITEDTNPEHTTAVDDITSVMPSADEHTAP